MTMGKGYWALSKNALEWVSDDDLLNFQKLGRKDSKKLKIDTEKFLEKIINENKYSTRTKLT